MTDVQVNNSGRVLLELDNNLVDADGDTGNFLLKDIQDLTIEAQANGAPDNAALWVTRADGGQLTELFFETGGYVTPKVPPKTDQTKPNFTNREKIATLALMVVILLLGVVLGAVLF